MTCTKLIFGCGYLGRRVASAWLARGDVVHAVTRSQERAAVWRNEGLLRPIVADVCEADTLGDLPAVDTVLYAVGYDRASGRSQHEVAVGGLQHVLSRMAGRYGRLVLISSSSVYGQSNGEWVDETSPTLPNQPGGECSLKAECLERKVEDKIGHVLRLSGIYGPQRLLSRIDALKAGTPFTGRADAWLNLIHVDDAVQAVLACEDRSESATVLVSDNRPVLRGEYYAHLAHLVGAPLPVFDESQPAKRGSGGINKRCDNRRLREMLGVTFRYPTFVEGLAASVESG